MIDANLDAARHRLVRRGKLLSYTTVGYNSLEGAAAIVAGVFAGSVSLVGFGVDSIIEVTSSGAALYRLRHDATAEGRERSEQISLRIVGVCFVALAIYIAVDAAASLWRRQLPDKTIPGVIITAASVVVMPVLARAKRKVAVELNSRALSADATQADLCAYISTIALVGLVLNWALGCWWADPASALIMAPIIAREGIVALRPKKADSGDAPGRG